MSKVIQYLSRSMQTPESLLRLNDHLSISEKINFARHLSLVIRAGLPIYEGLKIIRSQPNSRTMNRVLDQLMADVNNGRFLSDSLEKFGTLFGDFFINVIRVGEISGNLSHNLLYLAEELKKSKDLVSKVRSAMVYPMIILVMTLGVTGFLSFVILPKLLPVLSGLGVQLPITTQIMIASVTFLRVNGLWVLIGFFILATIYRLMMRHVRPFKYAMNWLIFFTPVISPLLVAINMVTFTRVFSMLLKSGIKIVEALDITSATLPNLVYQEALKRANEEVKRGGQLATLLTKDRRHFPALVSGMIQVGENTGNLEENLAYIADYYNDEVDNRLRNLTSFLEPIMLMFMGLLVGFVAISIITPIYSMSQGVR